MVDYIGSDTIKKYYKEQEIVLSDRMIAARICNAGFCMEEVHSSLREIQARTEDADLRGQIEKYISREMAMYEEVKKAGAGEFYRLSVRYEEDNENCENGYFSDFDTAFLVGREMTNVEKDICKYEIEKFHIIDRPQLPDKEAYWELGHAEGCAEYDRNGNLTSVWVHMEEDEYEGADFSEEYFYYPHPFQRGDILVRRGDDEYLYVMTMDQESVKEHDRRRSVWGDFSDIGIAGTMICRRTGRIWGMDEWIHPFEFEYAPIDKRTEDIMEQAALEMQRILVGKTGSFQYIFDACARRQEEYLESKRISLITGIELHPHNVLF